MNSITAFDIRLNKDVYYLGESVLGNVILGNSQNIQVEGMAHRQSQTTTISFVLFSGITIQF